MNNTRKIAVDILDAIINKGGYSNIVLNAKLNKVNLEERDKALVTEIIYGTLKYKYTIDKILCSFLKTPINKQDSTILNILRVTIYQIRYLDKIPEFAAVNEAVEMTKKYKSIGASKLVNAVLRNYLRNKSKVYYNPDNKIEHLCFNYSYEPWMVKLFIKQYGEETAEKILYGLNSTPNVTIRINSLKVNYEDACEKLRQYGYEIEEGIVCPEAVRIIRGRSIEHNPLFKEGLATVQDESAMLVASSMDITSEIVALDLCSAPGGKATHISELMNNTGKVFAFDIHKDKLSLIKQNAKRLGINNIICEVMDASIYNNNLKNSAERVLIDVPCSGLGIIRKKPEIKWTKEYEQFNKIIEIQRKIMSNAALYVKVGGVLLYSTCTINKEENEENVKWFLNNYKDYKLEPLFFGNVDNFIYSDFGLTILPNKYMDGFFIAKFKKVR
ncbi:16S rRNA (cytosine(967)-C(5))-methyltransferase RsmB [Clostridium sp. SYSU_GA19001]|uniref:16S rRNA (cytosine(967)-C(5))-methyltransferase RsmB n=1 Tax=Clostridium caldaquaticum TaxID=2940653 RepID=UPI0020770620|nr:16S rRNA (cytosine(967)-C(5))-methyltransferase RsmB [Clostridium caldaquaticum]MCM8710571.1 16S rRNA (cytosine(967)-C(5))-methyltransferase RsmB [Clostridium caldaquaticum]